jgi:ParB family chromosome partitioning protein
MVGGNRKNELKALFAGGPMKPTPQPTAAPETKSATPAQTGQGELTAVNSAPASAAVAPVSSGDVPRAASGAVRAMGLTLGAISREAEEARHLRQALTDGERVVSLDPSLIDGSFVSDRLSEAERDDGDFLGLVESIRENGQQSPILVRPHPDREGRYQTAYGHRRLRAVARLGRPVKAIVRALSDDDLVLAQGKENAERRNLSFIERALFAKALVAHGFDRKVAGDALAVDKTELSRLLQVADAIPEQIVGGIGPAPKAGRPRWMALGALLAGEGRRIIAIEELGGDAYRAADSDRRFAMLFARLSIKPQPAAAAEELKDAKGKVFARVKREGRAARIDFAPGVDPAFIDEAAALLAERYAAFADGTKK